MIMKVNFLKRDIIANIGNASAQGLKLNLERILALFPQFENLALGEYAKIDSTTIFEELSVKLIMLLVLFKVSLLVVC